MFDMAKDHESSKMDCNAFSFGPSLHLMSLFDLGKIPCDTILELLPLFVNGFSCFWYAHGFLDGYWCVYHGNVVVGCVAGWCNVVVVFGVIVSGVIGFIVIVVVFVMGWLMVLGTYGCIEGLGLLATWHCWYFVDTYLLSCVCQGFDVVLHVVDVDGFTYVSLSSGLFA